MQMQSIVSGTKRNMMDSMKATAGNNMAQLYVPTMFDSIAAQIVNMVSGNQIFTFASLQAASKAKSALRKETGLAASMQMSIKL